MLRKRELGTFIKKITFINNFRYGLILSKKQQTATPKVSNVFGNDDESDEEDGTDWVKKALKAEEEKNKVKKQTKLNIQKALKEDPTIYQYDEIYDDLERSKNQSKETKEEKKSKYIQNLLKAAERRKREQEHRIERMVQLEREAEGSMYADKESFVTSAYRAKLEEFKKMEEEESRMERLEAIADVRKQQDMSGFYRHLYEQTVKDPGDTKEDNTHVDNNIKNLNKGLCDNSLNEDEIASKKTKKVRQYRQRVVDEESDSDSEIQPENKDVAQNETKISISEKHKSDEKEIGEPDVKKQKQENEICSEQKPIDDDIEQEKDSESKDTENLAEKTENDAKAEEAHNRAKAKIEAEKKERSKIWEKRTVGSTFEAALQRYYARKATRLSAAS